jgi:hypothetical protein
VVTWQETCACVDIVQTAAFWSQIGNTDLNEFTQETTSQHLHCPTASHFALCPRDRKEAHVTLFFSLEILLANMIAAMKHRCCSSEDADVAKIDCLHFNPGFEQEEGANTGNSLASDSNYANKAGDANDDPRAPRNSKGAKGQSDPRKSSSNFHAAPHRAEYCYPRRSRRRSWQQQSPPAATSLLNVDRIVETHADHQQHPLCWVFIVRQMVQKVLVRILNVVLE